VNREALAEAWRREEQVPFAGWDFSHLRGRMIEERPPWSYPERAATLLRGATSALDMGTGGGERLLALREDWPPRVVATEDYGPNVALAAQRLAPHGAQVVWATLSEQDPLPFAEGAFDLVLNRHSALNPAEVARVLAPGGTLYTEQVHGLWAADLLAEFGATPQWPDSSPSRCVRRLAAADLRTVDAREWSGRLSFTDVGAMVYYLRAVPWLVPGFSVERDLARLLALQERLERGAGLDFTARLYFIEALRPA